MRWNSVDIFFDLLYSHLIRIYPSQVLRYWHNSHWWFSIQITCLTIIHIIFPTNKETNSGLDVNVPVFCGLDSTANTQYDLAAMQVGMGSMDLVMSVTAK